LPAAFFRAFRLRSALTTREKCNQQIAALDRELEAARATVAVPAPVIDRKRLAAGLVRVFGGFHKRPAPLMLLGAVTLVLFIACRKLSGARWSALGLGLAVSFAVRRVLSGLVLGVSTQIHGSMPRRPAAHPPRHSRLVSPCPPRFARFSADRPPLGIGAGTIDCSR
jgi:hypothetical protein